MAVRLWLRGRSSPDTESKDKCLRAYFVRVGGAQRVFPTLDASSHFYAYWPSKASPNSKATIADMMEVSPFFETPSCPRARPRHCQRRELSSVFGVADSRSDASLVHEHRDPQELLSPPSDHTAQTQPSSINLITISAELSRLRSCYYTTGRPERLRPTRPSQWH